MEVLMGVEISVKEGRKEGGKERRLTKKKE